MNRSIFQIWTPLFNITLTILLFFTFSLLECNVKTNCLGLINYGDILLNGSYKNIFFKYSKNCCLTQIHQNIDFLSTINLNNYDYGLCKYYKNVNGILIPFEKNTPFFHPHIYINTYGDVSSSIQLSHFNHKNNFLLFDKKDMIGINKPQFIAKIPHFYDNEIIPLYLNYNHLHFNEPYLNLNKNLICKETKNSILMQNFLNHKIKSFNCIPFYFQKNKFYF